MLGSSPWQLPFPTIAGVAPLPRPPRQLSLLFAAPPPRRRLSTPRCHSSPIRRPVATAASPSTELSRSGLLSSLDPVWWLDSVAVVQRSSTAQRWHVKDDDDGDSLVCLPPCLVLSFSALATVLSFPKESLTHFDEERGINFASAFLT